MCLSRSLRQFRAQSCHKPWRAKLLRLAAAYTSYGTADKILRRLTAYEVYGGLWRRLGALLWIRHLAARWTTEFSSGLTALWLQLPGKSFATGHSDFWTTVLHLFTWSQHWLCSVWNKMWLVSSSVSASSACHHNNSMSSASISWTLTIFFVWTMNILIQSVTFCVKQQSNCTLIF